MLNQCLVNQMGLSILTISLYHCFTALKFAHDIGSCQRSDSISVITRISWMPRRSFINYSQFYRIGLRLCEQNRSYRGRIHPHPSSLLSLSWPNYYRRRSRKLEAAEKVEWRGRGRGGAERGLSIEWDWFSFLFWILYPLSGMEAAAKTQNRDGVK